MNPFLKFGRVVLFCLPACLTGCGSSHEFSTTPVNGIVTCNGTPISGGTISFIPLNPDVKTMTGKPASAEISADGKFSLSTYAAGDGAIIGKHTVQVLPPSLKDDRAKPVPFPCANATIEIEIQKGAGKDLKIELSGT